MTDAIFGDGSDGVLEAGDIVELTRDAQYERVEPGARVRQNGFRILVRGAITVDEGTFGVVDGVTHFGRKP